MKNIISYQHFNESKETYQEIASSIFPNKKIAFVDLKKHTFEYKGKIKTYTVTSTASSFIRHKDIVCLVNKGKLIGWKDAEEMSTIMNVAGGDCVYSQERYKKMPELWEQSQKLKDVNKDSGIFEK